MSFLSASVPKKVSDNQFIGDLMNLFERRKIKTGDLATFENFAPTLASNDAFRSQLFTLCTAISHMSADDLSGEQLLALVARALGGPGLPKRDGTVEVPDSMRSAFLAGYEAWTNRTFEPKEPLSWPAPRQPEQREEPLPTPQPADAEPAASRPAVPGARTLQEALDIVRERSLADPAMHPARPDANTEGLTLSELKALLEEIENRVNRLQPHLHDLTSAIHSPADAFGRRATIHETDAAHPLNAAVPAAGIETPPAVPPMDAAAPPLAADAAPGQAAHRASRPSRIDEAAFFARHAYLRPASRVVQNSHAAAGVISAPAVAPLAVPPAPVPPGPLLAVTPAAAVAAVPEPVAAALPAPSELSHAADPIPAAPTAAVPAAARPDPPPYVPWVEPASLAMGRLRVTPRMATGTFITFAALIVVISGLAGLFIYPSLHPKTINDYPDLKPLAPSDSSSQGSAAPGDAAQAQIVLAAPGDPSMALYSPQSSHNGTSAASKPRPKAPQPPPPAAVWPYTNQVTVRDAVAAPPASSLPGAGTAAHRTAPPAPPLYVPSTTMIAYALSAPQPSYPKDQPRGISGTVVVQITISQEGYVTEIRVVSGPIEMRPATVQAVQAWRFKPYLVNGTPAEVTTTLGFLFRGQ
jgi:protein TonB